MEELRHERDPAGRELSRRVRLRVDRSKRRAFPFDNFPSVRVNELNRLLSVVGSKVTQLEAGAPNLVVVEVINLFNFVEQDEVRSRLAERLGAWRPVSAVLLMQTDLLPCPPRRASRTNFFEGPSDAGLRRRGLLLWNPAANVPLRWDEKLVLQSAFFA